MMMMTKVAMVVSIMIVLVTTANYNISRSTLAQSKVD